MKNKLLLGVFLFAGAGITSAQTVQGLSTVAKSADAFTESSEKYPAISAKALGQVVWHDNFDELKYGPGLSSTGTHTWTIDNDGQTLPTTGWSINGTNEGCYVIGNAFAGGNYAQVVNRTTACTTAPFGAVVEVTYRMTSSVIDVAALTGSANAIFSFQQDGMGHNDYQRVFISTDGTAWTKIYDNIEKYGTGNRYNTVTEEVDITSYILSSPNSVQFRFEQGQRFPSDPTDPNNAWVGFTYGWSIDNVKISTKADYDVAVSSTYHHTEAFHYTQIPLAQVAPIEFQARVSNQGGQDLTGLKLALDINSGTETAESASPMTLATNTADTLKAIYTPSAVADYVIAQSILMDDTDDAPANNTNLPNVRFAVTDFIYAVDEASLGTPVARFPEEGYVSGGAPIVFKRFGIAFDVFANQTLHAADIQLFGGSNPAQSTADGVEIGVQLYDLSDPGFSATSTFVTESDIYAVSASELNSIITVPFLTPYTVQAGKSYILVVTKEYASDNIAFSVSGENDRQSYAFGTIGGSDTWTRIIDNTPVVRANFEPGAGIKDNKAVTTEVSIFPNPATDKATVNFNTVNASDVSIQVVDVTGKVVETVSLNNVAAGANSADLNIAGFATGIYSVVVKTNDSSVTKKLVIK
jgi:hypothetical protein